jgi:hypothetical protein
VEGGQGVAVMRPKPGELTTGDLEALEPDEGREIAALQANIEQLHPGGRARAGVARRAPALAELAAHGAAEGGQARGAQADEIGRTTACAASWNEPPVTPMRRF